MASSYATLHHLAIYKEHTYIYSATFQYHTIQHHDYDMHIVHRSVLYIYTILYIMLYIILYIVPIYNTIYVYIYMCGPSAKGHEAGAIQSNKAKL